MTTRRRLLFICLGLLAAAAAFAAVTGAIPAESTAATAAPTVIDVRVPVEVPAGETVPVELIVEHTDDEAWVDVVAIGASTTTQHRVAVTAGRGRLVLGPPLTNRAGLVSLLVGNADAPIHAGFTVTAGPAASIDPLAGPRTIVADASDETMVVTVPVDAFGNPQPDGTAGTIALAGPGSTTAEWSVTTVGGIAAVRVTSSTQAGPLAFAATSGNARGPAVRVDQVAGDPIAFGLGLPESEADRPLFADGRSLHRLVTDEVVDTYGNVMADGVSADIRLETPRGPGRATTVVIGGRAEIWIEAPSEPGRVVVDATISGVTSDPVVLDFASAVDSLPARIDTTGDTPMVLVGPVLDHRGAFVPDGTLALVGGVEATIQHGIATVPLSSAATADGPVSITVLGTTISLEPTS